MTVRRLVRPQHGLILASRSPRRRSLLTQVGISFDVRAADVDESVRPSESPVDYTRRMAEEKARAAARHAPEAWVLGADTSVTLDGLILGIPASREEAVKMLATLSGRTHVVVTSFCLYRSQTEECLAQSVESFVLFKDLTKEEIEGYVLSGEPFDKAGGYAVQGLGAFMVREVHGSFTTVVGLPLCEVIEAMKKLGVVGTFP